MSTENLQYDPNLGCFKEVMSKPTIEAISSMVGKVNSLCSKFVHSVITQIGQQGEVGKEDFPEDLQEIYDSLTPAQREKYIELYNLRKPAPKPTSIEIDGSILGNFVHIKELSIPSARKPLCAGAKVLGFAIYKANQERKSAVAEYIDVAPLSDGTYLVVKALDGLRIGTAQRNVTDPTTKKTKRVCHGMYDRLTRQGISNQGSLCQDCPNAPHKYVYEAGKEKEKNFFCVAALEQVIFIIGRLVTTETTPEGEIKTSYSQPTMIGPVILSLTGKWGFELMKTDFRIQSPVIVKITSMEMEGTTQKNKVIKTGTVENPIIKGSTQGIGAAFKLITENRHLPTTTTEPQGEMV